MKQKAVAYGKKLSFSASQNGFVFDGNVEEYECSKLGLHRYVFAQIAHNKCRLKALAISGLKTLFSNNGDGILGKGCLRKMLYNGTFSLH